MRPACARIDLSALIHNHALARQLGGHQVLAVVKADAYGHGAVACARALAPHTDGFGVAAIDEAIALREAGIRAPILLLEGCFSASELPLIEQHALWTVVASTWQLEALERYHATCRWNIWLKIDTGMHRLGFAPGDVATVWQRLRALPWIDSIVLMTHFARADEPDASSTDEQLMRFERSVATLPPDTRFSLANSAAILAWPPTRRDWVRPGLMLYGASTLPATCTDVSALRPVMQLESAIIAIRDLAPGESIGYGGSFVTARPTRVGVVALGYADGYPQQAPAGTPVAVGGERSQLIGRVSMDMLTIDLTGIDHVGIGSRVELWGRNLPVADIARITHTSPYRLLSGLKRVRRCYPSDHEP